jgi:hypothetical protein
MRLSIAERAALLGILPREGNIVTLRIVRDLKGALSFSEEEIREAEIQTTAEGWVFWNPAKAIESEIEIGPTALGVIRDSLKAANDKGKLTETTAGLYERFIEQN